MEEQKKTSIDNCSMALKSYENEENKVKNALYKYYTSEDIKKQKEELYMPSNNINRITPCTWGVTKFENTKLIEVKNSVFTYRLSNLVDYINDFKMLYEIPAVKLKEEFIEKGYEIAWCNNLAHNITKRAELIIDEKTIVDSFDTVTADNHLDAIESIKSIDRVNEMIGNREELVTFGELLNGTKIECPMYFFTKRDGQNLKMCALYKSEVEVKVYCEQFLSKCILLRKRDGDSYEYITDPSIVISNMVDIGYDKGFELKHPDLLCENVYVSSGETDVVRRRRTINSISHINEYKLNKGKASENYHVKIDQPSLCNYLMMKVINMTAKELNNHSNYSTCPHDSEDGEDPIESWTLKYGNNVQYGNVDNSRMQRIFSDSLDIKMPDNFTSVVPFCKCLSSQEPNGAILNKTLNLNIDIKLQDEDISGQETNSEFEIHVRSYSSRLLIYNKGKLEIQD